MRLAAIAGLVWFCVLCLLTSLAAGQCDLRAGDSVWIQLTAPVASYSSKAGQKLSALVLQSPNCTGTPALPLGTEVSGRVIAVQKLGLGFFHESASLKLLFDRIDLKQEEELHLDATLLEIDNAREIVRNGIVRGILTTDSPEGRITSRLRHLPTWNPYTGWSMLAFRLTFPMMPEPEIYLPAGTQLRLRVNSPLVMPQSTEVAEVPEPTSPDLAVRLRAAPDRTTTPKGVASDLVNLALIGTQEQVERAFLSAGWIESDRLTTASVVREFGALLRLASYPAEPISSQWLQGVPADLNYQKSFNSYAKRAHVRIYEYGSVEAGDPLWLASYTRETGAGFSARHHKFIHHVDADVDSGRDRLVNELQLAGCIRSSSVVDRPLMLREVINATGDPMRTQGQLPVANLQDCPSPGLNPPLAEAQLQRRPRLKIVRYCRTQILGLRTDLTRGNVLFAVFDLTRMGIRALRHAAPLPPAVLASGDHGNKPAPTIGAAAPTKPEPELHPTTR
ncbi:MAG: LssY C-terminal domain-containing protein [Acidobacteriales bacterium]|nr:LssY C-terminal domain-containing protein [Terriglobales bacterium]